MRKLFFILWAVFGGLLATGIISFLALSLEPNFMVVGFILTPIFLPAILFTKLVDYFVGPLNRTTMLFIMAIALFALCPAYAGLICLIVQKVKARKLFFSLWVLFSALWVTFVMLWVIGSSSAGPISRAFGAFYGFLLYTIFIPAFLISSLAESLFGYLHWSIHLYIIFFSSFILCALYAGLISFIVKKIKGHKAAKKP